MNFTYFGISEFFRLWLTTILYGTDTQDNIFKAKIKGLTLLYEKDILIEEYYPSHHSLCSKKESLILLAGYKPLHRRLLLYIFEKRGNSYLFELKVYSKLQLSNYTINSKLVVLQY